MLLVLRGRLIRVFLALLFISLFCFPLYFLESNIDYDRGLCYHMNNISYSIPISNMRPQYVHAQPTHYITKSEEFSSPIPLRLARFSISTSSTLYSSYTPRGSPTRLPCPSPRTEADLPRCTQGLRLLRKAMCRDSEEAQFLP